MKRLLFFTLGILLTAATPLRSMAQLDLNLNFNVGDNDYYGQIDPRGYDVITSNDEPLIILRDTYTTPTPLYLRVQPLHRRHWEQYCYLYNACDQLVFFVQDDWYINRYIPTYRRHYHRDQRFIPQYYYDYRRQDPDRNRNWNQWNNRYAPSRAGQPRGGDFNIQIDQSREQRRGGYAPNTAPRYDQQTVIERVGPAPQPSANRPSPYDQKRVLPPARIDQRGAATNPVPYQQQTVTESVGPAPQPSRYSQPHANPPSPYAQQPAANSVPASAPARNEQPRGSRYGRRQDDQGDK